MKFARCYIPDCSRSAITTYVRQPICREHLRIISTAVAIENALKAGDEKKAKRLRGRLLGLAGDLAKSNSPAAKKGPVKLAFREAKKAPRQED